MEIFFITLTIIIVFLLWGHQMYRIFNNWHRIDFNKIKIGDEIRVKIGKNIKQGTVLIKEPLHIVLVKNGEKILAFENIGTFEKFIE